ncbi:MAG: molybdopterin-dependent oxidoreductase [Terriglobales bacterium]
MTQPGGAEQVINTVCHDHCTNECFLRVHVKDGRVVRVETDNGPEPQFRACVRGRAHRQLLHHPDRLKYPLKRVGERGEGKFERISWDEALQTVASQILRVRATYGARSTILLCSAGDLGYLHEGGLIDRVLNRVGGYTGVIGTVSDQATRIAAIATYGVDNAMCGNSVDSLLSARMIILWGINPVVTRNYLGHIAHFFPQLKKPGVKVVSVDPRYTETASFLDAQWIPIRPSTDAAMLVAMAYVIIKENLQDQAFLDKYTAGFEEYKKYVLGDEDGIPKTPGWAEEITGVPAATIVSLAKEYATTKPAALLDGLAPGRTARGEQYNRAAAALTCMTGNLGIKGGSSGCGPMQVDDPYIKLHVLNGVHVDMKCDGNPVDKASPLRTDSIYYHREKRKNFPSIPETGHYYLGGPSTAYLLRPRVADAILQGKEGGYPADYKLLYIVTCNWVNQYGNSNKLIQALNKLEFMVCHEQFMTATARYADIILPQNTFFERNDITGSPNFPFYGFRAKAIGSLGESRSTFEIATGLAAKLGITDFTDKTEEEWLRQAAKTYGIPDYEQFKKDAMYRVPRNTVVAFEKQICDPENNPFPTPSGKVEIFCQALADLGDPDLPAVPKYIEPWESVNDPLAKKYPLQLISSHYFRRVHSRFDNVPWLRELEPQAVLVNSADARSRGIQDGDLVRVFNDRGQTLLPACVSERIMPGIVDIPEGAWLSLDENGVDRGGCPNVLLNDLCSPGGGLACNTALVQVEKAEGRVC